MRLQKLMCRQQMLFPFPLCLELVSSQHNHIAIQKFIFTSVNYDWRVQRKAHRLHLIPHFEMKWGKLWNRQNHNDKITGLIMRLYTYWYRTEKMRWDWTHLSMYIHMQYNTPKAVHSHLKAHKIHNNSVHVSIPCVWNIHKYHISFRI
jgi:hypothetical protein